MTYIPIEDQPAVVEDMARAIVRGYSPLELILFGSRARGDEDEFSDADFVAVIDTEDDTEAIERDIVRSLERFGLDSHVMVRTPRQYQRESRVPGSLMYPVGKEGVVLHQWPSWRERFPVPFDPKADLAMVLEREFRAKVREYLEGARSQLTLSGWLRCRDLCRYAAVVALKGVSAVHGVHPPREVDVAFQFSTALALEPALGELAEDAEALHWAEPENEESAAALVKTTDQMVRAVLALYTEDV